MLVLVPLVLALQPALDRIELGDELAAALGIRVERTRLVAGFAAILLAALARGIGRAAAVRGVRLGADRAADERGFGGCRW